ncbi:MAG: DUF3824 domain-containing protein [Actinomycetota bacterium]|nr:DUF3824 domain-containing protein [Actinomycetota bacterium]
MRRYRFPLATVLRVRTLQQEQARARLGTAVAAEVAAAGAVQDSLDRYQNSVQSGREVVALSAFLASRQQSTARALSVRSAEGLQLQATRDRAEAFGAWTVAAGAESALRRLDERHRAEYQREVLREDDRAIDELVVGRTYRKGRAS